MIDLFKKDKLKGEKKGEEKEPKKELTIVGIILDFSSFSLMILFFAFFYMGALSTGQSSDEQFKTNLTESLDLVSKTLTGVFITFYDNGKERPEVFTFLFWATIVFWFYGLGSDIWDYKKQKKNKKKIKIDRAIDLVGSVGDVVT